MSHLLIVDDEEAICWGLKRLGTRSGHSVDVASNAEAGLELAAKRAPDLIILDVRLPGMDGLTAMNKFQTLAPQAEVVVITAFGNLETAVAAVRNGAFDYLTKPFDLEQVTSVIARATERADRETSANQLPELKEFKDEILGNSPPMQEVFKKIALVAASDASVLITGESGTGKELVARAIHRHSLRSSLPLIPIHLAALSPTLIESELFGHVKGSFTGAEASRAGLLELADGATVFFDEAADIPLSTQVKLLRVLEQHELSAVGDTNVRSVQFRTITATSRNLQQEFQSGAFRQDLYFRLATFEIKLPPLRDRVGDIPLLAERFLRRAISNVRSVGFTSAAINELVSRHWPGNVRELRNAVEHAALLSRGAAVDVHHLPPPLTLDPSQADPVGQLKDAVRRWASQQLVDNESSTHLYDDFLAQVEPPLFDEVLNTTSNNRAAAAELLGIHRATLRKKLSGT
jgi:two-component system nitrogen regulation response regulator GlnG